MYGIQEILAKTKEQRDKIESYMDSKKSYDPSEANIYMGQKRSIQRELRESIRATPLIRLIHEYLISGLAGASYLIPTKLADIFFTAAQPIDIAPLISAEMINGWDGGDLKMDIPDRYSMKAAYSGSGGSRAPRTPTTTQATLSPKAFSAPLVAESSMIEDSQYNLVEWYAKQAARSIAWQSNDMVLEVLKTATDGVGTVNSSLTGDADETKLTSGTTSDIVTAFRKLGDDEWTPNTLVATSEAWGHSITMQAKPTGWDNIQPAPRFTCAIGPVDVLVNNSPMLHVSSDARGAAFTDCITVLFDRSAALLTGRKRWMLMENYVDPVKDLEGLIVSSRQDSITLHDDSIYVLTET